MTHWLNSDERRTLKHLCRTLVPALAPAEGNPESNIGAKQVDLADQVEQALPHITSDAERGQLRLFFWALGNPLVNGLLSGYWQPFYRLKLAEQQQILLDWMTSRIGLRRSAFQAVKRLALFLFYSWTPESGPNPVWPIIGYQAPAAPKTPTEPGLKTMRWRGQDRLSAEVLVIGSGAGGSVVAAELAAAGRQVLVVEKGGDESPCEVGGYELEGNAALFERRGGLTTADLGVVVLAGSTLGGGTVVNWSTSLPTPASVRREWDREFGFEGVEGPAYDHSTRIIQRRLNVNMDESQANAQNQVLARGGRAQGYKVEIIPRNVKGCVDCTYCGFGCRYRAKQDARGTFLVQAQRDGAEIMVRARVERVLIQAGRAVGALVTLNRNGQRHQLTITADAVVVAAGSVHTPALLLRSGLAHPQLGRNLRLHPVTAPVGIFHEPIRSWQGPPQTRVVADMSDLDGGGYGVRLEVAPAHPGLWASSLPWTGGSDHKQLMAQVDHLANIIVLTRDHGSGKVELGNNGQPVLHYQLAEYDRRHLQQGAAAALGILRAAGAHTIISPHTSPLAYEESKDDDFDTFVKAAMDKAVGPNQWGLFSAHQMGSCRIAGTRKLGVVRPDGRTWEVEGLFVADASVFPTASGVNPMITIMASAHLLSQRIISQLY